MNTYLVEYQQAGDPTVTGSASLVANDDQHAANVFHRCYADEPYRIITKMTRVFVNGERKDEDVLCYPVQLGGGPVDLTPTPSVVCDCGKVIVSDDGMCGCGLHVSDLDYGPRMWGLHV